MNRVSEPNRHVGSITGVPLFIMLLLIGTFAVGCGGNDDETTTSNESGVTTLSYPINATGQTSCYNNTDKISCPKAGEPFFGQDAQSVSKKMSFKDNGDKTVTDKNTGLMWAKEQGSQVTQEEAISGAETFDLAGHSDWRLPTIKELYSLIDFNGSWFSTAENSTPYVETKYFGFSYGDESTGERLMDVQYVSSTEYVGTTMNGDDTVFGVNFADGRIKGYPISKPDGTTKKFYVKYVRNNKKYGETAFADNDDGTITDKATELMWQKADSSKTYNWEEALAYCEDLKAVGGHSDWRLPNAKELQSIVDYSRAPKVTNSAAIDPIFDVTTEESYFWTSTTHLDGPPDVQGTSAIYVAFGRAMGFMEQPPNSGQFELLDVHGAGSQRSDPKTGDASDYPNGHGPQGDVIKIDNYARCVRDA